MKSIGIVIPAYNEKKNIIKLIKAIRRKINCVIIIVDDSTNLETQKIILRNKVKNLKYFNRGKKSGRGSAVLFGFRKLIQIKKNIDCIIEMDADLSHSPNELLRNLKFFFRNSSDLLIGSRYVKGSQILNWPLSRRILSKLSNILAKFLLGVPVNDYTNGFRFYSKRAAKTIISKCNTTGGGFIILSEIILILWLKGFRITEIKSIFKNRTRGESSVNFMLICESFFGLLKLYLLKKTTKI